MPGLHRVALPLRRPGRVRFGSLCHASVNSPTCAGDALPLPVSPARHVPVLDTRHRGVRRRSTGAGPILLDGLAQAAARQLFGTVAFGLCGGGSYAAAAPIACRSTSVPHPRGTTCTPVRAVRKVYDRRECLPPRDRGLEYAGRLGLLVRTGFGGIAIGIVWLPAAWTGRDPYVVGWISRWPAHALHDDPGPAVSSGF